MTGLSRLDTATKRRENLEHQGCSHVLSRVMHKEELMLKSAIVAASVCLATAALAQGNTQKSGPGQSEFAPGHQPNTTKGPGHSESAPGQQPNKAGPGHSESAPGQQSTTGSSTRTKK